MSASTDPLLRLLVTKGVLNATEVNALAGVPVGEVRDRLLFLLKDKGVLSAADVADLNSAVPATATAPATSAPAASAATASATTTIATTTVSQGQSGPPQPPKTPPASGPMPPIAPIRVLQLDPSKREGFIPDIKIGKRSSLEPYGFFKATPCMTRRRLTAMISRCRV